MLQILTIRHFATILVICFLLLISLTLVTTGVQATTPVSRPVISDMTWSQATEMSLLDSFTPICGVPLFINNPITTDTTWTTDHLYILQSDITVNAGVTLTIQPGVVVKAQYNHSLYINGKLIADGTETNPIYFTAWTDDTLCGDTNGDGTATVPAIGDWGWIEFAPESDSSSILRRASMSYGGRDNIIGADWHGVIRLNKVSPTLENLTLQNNYRNAAELIAGNWQNAALSSTSVVYWLYGDSTVLAANTLTIAPGAIVKATQDSMLQISGRLLAVGTTDALIIFTSEKDDSACGNGVNGAPICDTNSDGAGSVPAKGDWAYIHFADTSDDASIISYAILRYGGSDSSAINDGIVRLQSASPTISYTRLTTSHHGIEAFGDSIPTLFCNDIFNNSGFGISNDTPQTQITAEYHWWGSSAGPTHSSNPGGSGQSVTDGVDFVPWASATCLLGPTPSFDSVFLPFITN